MSAVDQASLAQGSRGCLDLSLASCWPLWIGQRYSSPPGLGWAQAGSGARGDQLGTWFDPQGESCLSLHDPHP